MSPLPVHLMTAAERAGYRAAIELIRAEGARMRRAAVLIASGDAPAPVDGLYQHQKNQILDLCGRAVELCCDRAEAEIQPLLN